MWNPDHNFVVPVLVKVCAVCVQCAQIVFHTLHKSDFALGGILCSSILEHTHAQKYAALSFESTYE